MRRVASLTWLTARPARTGASTLVLPFVAYAVTTALLLVLVGGAQAFWSAPGDDGPVYGALAAIALALLVAPLAGLGGSAARLAARRRDDRLATLSLLGASTRTVRAVAVLETAAVALAGALSGVVVAVLAAPLVQLIPFAGVDLTTASVLLGPGWTLLVLLGVLLVAGVSAVLALRRVTVSPLGVRLRSDPPRVPWLLVVIAVAVLLVLVGVMGSVLQMGSALGVVGVVAFIAGAYAVALGILNLLGPWVVRLVASARLRRAGTAERLLAARSVLDSPKEAWGQVSGVAMTSAVAVVAGSGVALMRSAQAGGDSSDAALTSDLGTGLVVTIVASFLMTACSVGVNQAAAALDRAEVTGGLHKLGVGLPTLESARRGAVLVPLLVASLGSATAAAVLTFPLAGMAVVLSPASVLVTASAIALGIGLVLLGLRATRPVVVSTLA